MKTSELFPGGGGSIPYESGIPHWWTIPNNLATTGGGVSNYDLLQPFRARADMTVDKVAWLRHAGSASNVYVGIYDKTGTLLSDCAVDTDTTTSTHEVETTNFDISQGELYFWCLNQSSFPVANIDDTASNDPEILDRMLSGYVPDLSVMGTLPSAGYHLGGMWRNARTNAPLLSSITLSDFDAYDRIAMAGVTPA